WVSSSVVGSFRLRVIANSGASVIRSKNCRVSLKDGSDTYYCTSNTITFVVSDNCTVKYNTSGESAVSESVVTRGEKIAAPTSPFRSGYVFAGWFEDIDCKSKWDFSKNTVCENMTLYAGWVENGTSFDDVLATDWFFNDVMYVSLNGLMKGTGQRRFSPHVATTRAMIVTILHRLDGSPDFVDASSFPDITAGAYYEEAVAWAAVNGIVKGYNNGTFGPDDFITREQLATIFFRYAAYKDYKTLQRESLDRFYDSGSCSFYAVEALFWAVGFRAYQRYGRRSAKTRRAGCKSPGRSNSTQILYKRQVTYADFVLFLLSFAIMMTIPIQMPTSHVMGAAIYPSFVVSIPMAEDDAAAPYVHPEIEEASHRRAHVVTPEVERHERKAKVLQPYARALIREMKSTLNAFILPNMRMAIAARTIIIPYFSAKGCS
ncbi:MAG: hypothetical protein GX633_09910, partial [Clostridiales bacterium]|nr:hypothetical protein [Clostridiales bacterium]